MRALALLALAVAVSGGCGHYAPPKRAAETRKAAPVPAPANPVSAAPGQTATADEKCEEPAP